MKQYAFFFTIPALLLVHLACKKTEVANNDQFDFAKHYSITSSFHKDTNQFIVYVHLDDTLHAYALGETTGKPVTLAISPDNGWATDGPPSIPKGTIKKLGELGESMVLTGDIHITQKLKTGTGPGEAILYLQVCTKNACDRPRSHKLAIE